MIEKNFTATTVRELVQYPNPFFTVVNNMQKSIFNMIKELLAPAGDIEAGYAALYYGADAVYLGLQKFSARATATNFDEPHLNEFVAYFQLQQWKDAGLFLSQKSVIMSTYLLCGFANISSIGILLGGLGVLAPGKKELIARTGVKSMIGGALVSVLSATIIGMILG